MSGGHWNYLSDKIRERSAYNNIWELIADIEKCLDRGICGDDCYDCAKEIIITALIEYFDGNADSVEEAREIIKKQQAQKCQRCEKYQADS